MKTTKVVIAPPKRLFLTPDLKYYIMLPWFDRLGPTSLKEGFEFDILPEGQYRLYAHIPPDLEIDTEFTTKYGYTTTLRLSDNLSLPQRMAIDVSGEPTTLFIQRYRPHRAHFWVGHCESDERLGTLLSERSFYALSDEAQDDAYLSEFAESQNSNWYDHDFLEAGFEPFINSLPETFSSYSWSEQWVDELEERSRSYGIENPNGFIMLGGDPQEPLDWRLDDPRDIDRLDITMKYVGEIEFHHC